MPSFVFPTPSIVHMYDGQNYMPMGSPFGEALADPDVGSTVSRQPSFRDHLSYTELPCSRSYHFPKWLRHNEN